MSRVVEFDRFGGPEVLSIVAAPATEPAPGEVLVRIEAFAINPLDVMMRSGTSPAPVALPHARLGIEATGTVAALGEGVDGLAVDDPVIVTAIPDASTRGSYAEHLALPAAWVTPRTSGLGVTEAAAVWVAFSTAYGALIERAGLRPADRLLISGASGAVGRAAIQVANHIGAVPIALTRDAAKRDELLSVGARAVVVTGDQDTVTSVRDLTDGVGAEVTFDMVRGPGQQELLQATRPDGVLVAAGFLDPRPTPDPSDTSPTVIDYRGFDHLLDPLVVKRMAAFLEAGVRAGGLRPVVDTVYGLDDVAEAHRRFESGAHAGRKIVVTV